MREFDNYADAEKDLISQVILLPDYVTKTTYECLGKGFILNNPRENRNKRSDYLYAQKFLEWLLSGQTDLSKELAEHNPWVKRFVDSTGLPESFSASYGWKINTQLPKVIKELIHEPDSRRGCIMVLTPDDQVILGVETTHEYPCTISLHFILRDFFLEVDSPGKPIPGKKLHLMVSMRSNNIIKVMPYDVFNFTELQIKLFEELKDHIPNLRLGNYYHFINSAHVYKGDVRRWKESMDFKKISLGRVVIS